LKLFPCSAIDTKDPNVNIADEIQKILKAITQGEVTTEIPEPPTSGGRKSQMKRETTPAKEREDSQASNQS